MRSIRIMLVCAAVAAAATWSCGSKPHADTTPAAGDSVADAQRAVEAWRQAYEAHSFDAVAALYAHDKGTVIVSQGVPYTGWDAASAHLKDMLGRARELHVKLAGVTVDAIDEDCAVVVAQMDRDVSDGTLTTSERGVLTLVLHREAGGWIVVSEHYSYPHSA